MAWIPTRDKQGATGELAEIYARVAPGDAPLDNILAVHSLHPRSLSDHFALYRTLMYGPGPLSRRERELVAVRRHHVDGVVPVLRAVVGDGGAVRPGHLQQPDRMVAQTAATLVRYQARCPRRLAGRAHIERHLAIERRDLAHVARAAGRKGRRAQVLLAPAPRREVHPT